jgi:ribosomal protein S18 acetylase RimI-like enzyme
MEIDFSNLTSEKITDFHCLETFCSGVEAMDKFIQGDFRMSVENHYCSAYGVWYKEELVAIYALSFDSLDLDSDDKEELETGMSSTGTPNVDWNYKETFYAKPRYPALDIAYLAVREEYRGNKVGQSIVEMIADRARSQTFAGCQFLTVEALATSEYSAVGFYQRCGFTANEVRKPYKDTLRMFRTLYANEEEFVGDE